MRVLVLVNFVLVVVALVFAYMAYSRVETARKTAVDAAEGVRAAKSERDEQLRSFRQEINDRVANLAKAEAEAVKASLATRLSGLEKDLADLRNDVGNLPALADKVVRQRITEERGKTLEQVLNRLATLNTKIARLEKRLAEVPRAGGADADLRKRLETLEAEFAQWVEIIAPAEVAATEETK